jgi:putative ABC transport system permease protein
VALPGSDRLAVIYETNLPRNIPRFTASYPDYCAWRDQSRSWESIGAVTWRSMNLTGGGEPEYVGVRAMTASLLPTLGLTPAIGRGFLEQEDRPGHNRVAIVSHAFWQRRCGGRADVIGQSLVLDGASYAVVGVMPAGAFFPGGLEVGIPAGAEPAADRRYNHEFEVYGRLKPRVSLDQADAELKAINDRLYAGYADADRSWSTATIPLANEIVGPAVRTSLWVLLGAVGLLLIIACANLSNLLLVRAAARAHELAVRTALGAGRRRLLCQLVTESLVLAGIGGLLGVLLSFGCVGLLHAAPLPRAGEISVDGRVLALACGLTLIVGCLAGLAPALQASVAHPQDALKSRSPRSGRRSRLRDGAVVAQLALSLSLLVGAGLLLRSFERLIQVNPGFVTERVLTVSLRPGDDATAVALYERITARVAALPGVAGVGLISGLPLADGDSSNPVLPVGPTVLAPGEAVQSSWRLVDGGYFDAIRIPLLRGRSFAGLSPDQARQSVVLSASLARRLFGDADPIGRQVDQINPGEHRLTVIGVVGDVRFHRLSAAPGPSFYFSMHLFRSGPMRLVVRTTGGAEPFAAAIRRIVQEVDPAVPAFRVRTMAGIRADSVSHERLLALLVGGFAAAALSLAALGTYGVLAFTVQQRTRELGIRLAVGAPAGAILRLVLAAGLRYATLGILLGSAGAMAAGRMLASILYATSAVDAVSFGVAAAVLACAALGASLVPAWRAARVNPIVALRAE